MKLDNKIICKLVKARKDVNNTEILFLSTYINKVSETGI